MIVKVDIKIYNNPMDDKWDGDLEKYVSEMTGMCAKGKQYGFETLVLIREMDPIGNKTNYRCLQSCDYIVAIGLLTVAMDDMMAGDIPVVGEDDE